MKRTTIETLANDDILTSSGDVRTASLEVFQHQQRVAVNVDTRNDADKGMAGMSDNDRDIHGIIY